METFYSFVVDKNPSFYYQGWIIANSLIKNSNISANKIIVNAVKGVDENWLQHFRNLGVNVVEIEAFGDKKFCNKVQQLENSIIEKADCLILLDTDMIVLKDIQEIADTEFVKGRIVGGPNPSIETISEIFKIAGLKNSAKKIKIEFHPKHKTFSNYFNGGLYVIPAKYIHKINQSWKNWILWLIENKILLEKSNKINNIDQVAFLLSIVELEIPTNSLNSQYNFPISANKPIFPRILHYHKKLNGAGLLQNVNQNNFELNKAINFANAFIIDEIKSYFPENFDETIQKIILSYFTDLEIETLNKTNLFLHIGTSKTGTKSIQKFLEYNRENLKSQTFLYPNYNDVFNRRSFVKALLNGDIKKITGFIKEIIKQTDSNTKNIIFSHEALYFQLFEYQYVSKNLLLALSSICQIKIIVFLRPQPDFIESLYKQYIINCPKKYPLSINKYIELEKTKLNLDYNKSLEIFENDFGIKTISIFNYNKNIISSFCNYLNFNNNNNDEFYIHTSISKKQTNIIKFFIPTIPNRLRKIFIRFISILPIKDNENRHFLTANERTEIAEKYEEGNQHIAKKHSVELR